MTNIKNRKRNIKNTERNWSEEIAGIMRNISAKQENSVRKWRENVVSIMTKGVAISTESIRITTAITDIENAPMTNIVVTRTRIIKGIDTTIRAIGDPGMSGIDTEEDIQTYTGMEDIIVKMDT